VGAHGLVEEPLAKAEKPAAPEPTAEAEAEPSGPRSRWFLALKLGALAAVAGLLGLLLWATLAAGRGSSLVARIAAGKKPSAPGFTLGMIWPQHETWPPRLGAALADGKVDLRELRGHPVVLNFWASWCVPCRQEAPILHASALRHQGRVVFLGVDVKDLSGDARGFARKYRLNYVSVRDGSGDKTWSSYGLTGVPETYFVDARGRSVAHVPGAVSARTLEEGIATVTTPSRGGALRGGAHVTP
jgi:cytochrome c biogenesis protein CcmG, thiol:disulfide interchange protein DsbE